MKTPHLVYQGRTIPLTSTLVLGRHRDCDLQVEDKAASRQHVRIEVHAGNATAIDLDSANGTKLNGKRLREPTPLTHGDRLTIGETHLIVQVEASSSATNNAVPASASKRLRSPGGPEGLLGELLGGFRLVSLIGQGSLGTVYIAKQIKLDRQVALKVFDTSVADEAFTERLTGQARKAASIDHDNLASLHEWGHDGDILWYAMELVHGDTLLNLLERDGNIEPQMALLLVERVLNGLSAAHAAGVIHGDIKPANIMLTPGGTVKLLELGVAQVLMEGQQTAVGAAVVGTPAYMSPEQARCETLDQRSDLYALGCTLYHALVGEAPYRGRDATSILNAHMEQPIPLPSARVASLPAAVDRLIESLLTKNREWRCADCQEVLELVLAARSELRDQATAKPAPGTTSPPRAVAPVRQPGAAQASNRQGASRSRQRRQRSASGAITGLILVAAAVVAWIIIGPRLMQAPPPPESQTPAQAEQTNTRPNNQRPTPTIGPDPQAVAADTAFREALGEADDLAATQRFAEAEFHLAGLARDTNDPTAKAQIEGRLTRLQIAADTWVDQRLTALREDPRLTPRDQVAGLDELRNQVHQRRRGQVATAYATAVRDLRWRFNEARDDAAEMIRNGRASELPGLGAAVAGDLTGTALAGPAATFRARAAAAAQWPWAGTWSATRAGLDAASGSNALAAGATLMLIGERDQAVELLLAQTALDREPQRSQRDALLAGESLALDFTHPGDASALNVRYGDGVVVRDERLTAHPGEPVGIGVSPRLGGDRPWQIELDLRLVSLSDAEVLQTIVALGDTLRLVVDREGTRLEHAGERTAVERSGQRLNLRMSGRNNRVLVVVGTTLVADLPAQSVPDGATLSIDLAGMDWALDSLTVIGANAP